MEPEHAKFDEIINTVSPDEMRNPPPSEERGKNIAVFARFIANATRAGLLFRKKTATDSAGKSKTSTTATPMVRKIC